MRARSRALAISAALVAWSFLLPRLPGRWNPLPQMIFGAAAAIAARPALGVRPPALQRGLAWGGAAAAAVSVAVAAAVRLPAVRTGVGERDVPASAPRWLLLQIPFGTVWSEEVSFRAVLGTAAEDAFGPAAGRMLTAAVFGLSHIPDARAAGESIPLTVLTTGAAGWVFSWLQAASGSLIAPMLAHLAVNEAGAAAVLVEQRRRAVASLVGAVTG